MSLLKWTKPRNEERGRSLVSRSTPKRCIQCIPDVRNVERLINNSGTSLLLDIERWPWPCLCPSSPLIFGLHWIFCETLTCLPETICAPCSTTTGRTDTPWTFSTPSTRTRLWWCLWGTRDMPRLHDTKARFANILNTTSIIHSAIESFPFLRHNQTQNSINLIHSFSTGWSSRPTARTFT